jgi:hypothetical protein
MTNFFKYTYPFQDGTKTGRFVNLDLVADILVQQRNEKVIALQLLCNVPSTEEYEQLPARGKFDRNGNPVTNKKGESEVTFTHKLVKKHVIATITKTSEIQDLLTKLGDNPENYEYASEEELWGNGLQITSQALENATKDVEDLETNADTEE